MHSAIRFIEYICKTSALILDLPPSYHAVIRVLCLSPLLTIQSFLYVQSILRPQTKSTALIQENLADGDPSLLLEFLRLRRILRPPHDKWCGPPSSFLRPPPRTYAQEETWSQFADFVSHLRVPQHVVLRPVVEGIAPVVVLVAFIIADDHFVFPGRREEEGDGIRLV